MIKMNQDIKKTLESVAFAIEVALREGHAGVEFEVVENSNSRTSSSSVVQFAFPDTSWIRVFIWEPAKTSPKPPDETL